MIDLKKAQEKVIENKINHGFNTTDVCKEFCLLYGEVAESYEAYRKKKTDLGEELADVLVYLLGILLYINYLFLKKMKIENTKK